MRNDLQFGLTNAKLDQEIEAGVREFNPNMSDMAIEQEIKRVKKEMTHFNAHNTKSKSTRNPTTVGARNV